MVRINALYDAELARLKKLWAGAQPARSGRCRHAACAATASSAAPAAVERANAGRAGASDARAAAAAQRRASCAAARSTCAGLALPWLAFIAWPTSALNALSLPARNSSTDFGIGGDHLVDDPLERAGVAHLAQARAPRSARRRRSPLAGPRARRRPGARRCSRSCRRRCARSARPSVAARPAPRSIVDACRVQAPRDLAHDPVARPAWAAPLRLARRLEVGARMPWLCVIIAAS